MGKALITVGKDELQAMIDEDHGCELSCQFCNKKYQFSEEELKEIKIDYSRIVKTILFL